ADLRGLDIAGKHRRQKDAVVCRLRLGADHSDVEAIGYDARQLLDQPCAGHAVADDDETLPRMGHVTPPRGRGGDAARRGTPPPRRGRGYTRDLTPARAGDAGARAGSAAPRRWSRPGRWSS